jgi:hypothetical protein
MVFDLKKRLHLIKLNFVVDGGVNLTGVFVVVVAAAAAAFVFGINLLIIIKIFI